MSHPLSIVGSEVCWSVPLAGTACYSWHPLSRVKRVSLWILCLHVLFAFVLCLPSCPNPGKHLRAVGSVCIFCWPFFQRQEAAALLHPCWHLQSGFYICCHLANYFSLLFKKQKKSTPMTCLIQNQIILVWFTTGLLSPYKTLCLWNA